MVCAASAHALADGRGLELRSPLELSDDLEATDARAREAERLLKRSLRGALGDRLEELARSIPVLERLLSRGERSFAAGTAPDGSDPVPGLASTRSAAGPRGPLSASVGFHLDAHPRILLRTRLFTVQGRVEVPVLDREIRVSFDQRLGTRGWATLRGGLSAERGDWASFTLSLQF